jgi:hypothetical protein
VVVVRDAMKVLAVDTTLQVIASVTVPRAPQQVMVRPDGRVAYVSCDADQKGSRDRHFCLEGREDLGHRLLRTGWRGQRFRERAATQSTAK